MATNHSIDPNLIEQALKLSGERTKKAVVTKALQEFVARRWQKRLLELMGMQGMVTRKGWNDETWGANQRISVDEALKVLTINGAYASYEETIKGSIAAGKLADFVVLAEDPHSVDPDKIKDIAIVRTVTGGKAVYQA